MFFLYKKCIKRFSTMLLLFLCFGLLAEGLGSIRVVAARQTETVQMYYATTKWIGKVPQFASNPDFNHGQMYYYVVTNKDKKQLAYCIGYSKAVHSGDSYNVSSKDEYRELDDEQKRLIQYAYVLGFNGKDSNLESLTVNEKCHFVATQAFIWCVTESIYGTSNQSKAAKIICNAAPDNDVAWKYYQNLCKKVEELQLIPSFTVGSLAVLQTVDCYEMQWDESIQKYKGKFTDDNKVLKKYYSNIKIPGCEVKVDGDTLIIYSDKPLGGEITVAIEQKLPTELEMYGVSAYYTSSGIQPLFTIDSTLQKGDPVHCYFKLKTEIKIEGSVTITDLDSRNGDKLKGASFDLYEYYEITDRDPIWEWNEEEEKWEITGYGPEYIVESGYNYSGSLTDQGNGKYTTDVTATNANKGKFYVTQTDPPQYYHANNYLSNFTVSYGNSKYKDTCYNSPYKIRATVLKKDVETGKNVNNAIFGIYEYNKSSKAYIRISDFRTVSSNNKYNYITDWVYYSQSNQGKFRVIEDLASEGYFGDWKNVDTGKKKTYDLVLSSDAQTISITSENSDTITNQPQKGVIVITKMGENLVGVDYNGSNDLKAVFRYEYQIQEGAVFEVKAAEDIISPDKVTKLYNKGDLIATLTSGSDGLVKTEEIPLGKYTVTEIKAPYGLILDRYENNTQEVTLEYKGEDIDVYEHNITFTNERPRCYVDVVKHLQRSDEFADGAKYGLYAEEDIYNKLGEKVIEKNTLLEIGETCDTGYYIFTADIPIDVSYYVKEIEPDYIYEDGEDEYHFRYSYKNDTKYDYSYIHLWEIIKYTRKIAANTMDTLNPRSIWRTNPELNKRLREGFEREEPLYEFEFCHDDVLKAKEYIRENPLSRESNIEFYDNFCEPNRVK